MSKTSLTLFAGLLFVWACGGSGTAPADPGPPPSGTVAEALTIDLNNVPNYAAPAWPVDFDPATRNRVNDPIDNPITDRGALLGRVLFYDRHLSINQRVSCSSCHHQATGFTDNSRFSLGFNGKDRTTFRTMRLINARFYTPGTAFWDRRAPSLEAQSSQPIQNAVEMGFDSAHGGMDSVVARLQGLAYYNELFRWVYGDSVITQARMQLAIAQFVRSIVSYRTRFDSAWSASYNPAQPDGGLAEPFSGFTAQENRGKQLFIVLRASGGGGCASCHVPPTFALSVSSLSNGLDSGETRVFKSPSLRSAAIGGPYMHDGRFSTLAQVVDFYVNRVQEGPALDPRLRSGGRPQRLGMSRADQAALVAFLETLTDGAVGRDAKFGDPFKK